MSAIFRTAMTLHLESNWKLQFEKNNYLPLQLHYNELTRLRDENAELRARLAHYEQHELAHKSPFSDRFAQRIIESQVREIDRLTNALLDAKVPTPS